MLGQSPPTTSGIVVLSGSNNFSVNGDFPVFSSVSIKYHIEEPILTYPIDLVSSVSDDDISGAPTMLALIDIYGDVTPPAPLIMLAPSMIVDTLIVLPVLGLLNINIEEGFAQTKLMFVGDVDNTKITSTPVTTSGIVILDLFPGAGEDLIPYVPPIFINQRIFPVTFSGLGVRLFPEENRRIYPVLPQFSVVTPGD